MKPKCDNWGITKSRFMKEQETNGLLSSLGLKTSLNKIPFSVDILFWLYKNEWNCEYVFTSLVLLIVLTVHLLKTKKELRSSCKQGIQALFTKMILIKLASNMIRVMVN